MWTAGLAAPLRIWLAMSSARLMGIAKPSPPGVDSPSMVKFRVAAAFMPTTCPALLASAPPESPERRLVDDWMRPPISFLEPVSSSSAAIDRFRSVMTPDSCVIGLPEPLALPRVITGSPTATVFESPSGATGSPVAPRSCSRAMSLARS